MKRKPQDLSNEAIQSIWRKGIAEAANHSVVKQQLERQEGELLPRFAEHYEKLKTLPRRVRRSLQRRWRQSLAGIALLLVLGQTPALAGTINVEGGCTLIDAIGSANKDTAVGACQAGSGDDTIVLPKGSTQTLTTVNNTNVVGYNGLPAITSTITIQGNDATIRRAHDAPDFRIFYVDLGASLTLQETTVSGGRQVIAGAHQPAGGAIFNVGTLNLIDSTIFGNAAGFGGGIFNFHGALRLTNSTISGNKATTVSGGGVYNVYGAVNATNSTITENSAVYGGAMNTRTTITRSGECPIACTHAYDQGPVILTKTTISDNTAGQEGGGIFHIGGTAKLVKSTLTGNSAGTTGGGVYTGNNVPSENTPLTELVNSTVSGNSATRGGGVYVSSLLPGSARVLNSTITQNSAQKGGGVYVESDGASITFEQALISGNTASSTAGEVFVGADGLVTAGNFNLFGHSGRADVEGFTPGPTDIVPNNSLEAILNTNLANNGGQTLTHALVEHSPAVDAVTDGTCPPPATDQRNVKRPQDGNGDGAAICDIGSFERRPGE